MFSVKGTRPDNLYGTPVTANFDSDPCLEIVFPHRATTLEVYKACVPGKNAGEWEWRSEKSAGTAVVAEVDAGGEVVGPGYAFDVNADGVLDLLLTVSGEGGFQLNLAYSLGNGSFSSIDPATGAAVPDNTAGVYALLDDIPLAFGRLNADSYLDLVESGKVRFGSPIGDGQLSFDDAFSSKRSWSDALIADINADGRFDVIASTKGAADIDIYTNTGGAIWNPSTLSTDGTVENLQKGDFDGDLVSDIAFHDMLSTNESLLMIAYGRPSAGPEEPLEIGSFPDIHSIATGNVRTFGTDAITDLGVVSTLGGTLSLSFFPGAGNRVMQTPYLLTDKLNHVHLPIQTGLGFLRPWDGGDEAHNDVVALAFQPFAVDEMSDPLAVLEQYRSAMHVWGLFGAGEASFSAVDTATCPMPHGAFFLPSIREASSLVVNEAPLGSAAQVLVVTPSIDLNKDGTAILDVTALVSTAHFQGNGACSVDKPLHLDPGQLLFRMRAVDLNGNGTPEVLGIQGDYENAYLSNLLFSPNSAEPGAEPASGTGIDGQITSKLVIFWDGNMGQGDKLVPTVPEGQPETVSDYAIGDFDGDGRPEVVVVGPSGSLVYRVSESGDALEMSPLGTSLDLAGSRAVLLADADGDGVKDMVVAAGSLLEIWKGIPKREVGTDAPVSSGVGTR